MRRPRGPGAKPLHVIALVASFAITGAALVGWLDRPRDVPSVLVWFLAAIVLHDLVLLPLYTLLDRVAIGWLQRTTTRPRPAALEPGARRPGAISAAAYLRVPAIISALLFAVLFPVILGLGTRTALSVSGIAERGYLARWLGTCGVLFALSGVAYVVARARTRTTTGAGAADRGARIG